MNINVADLLNGNYILLLFVVLALGLCLGKLRLGSVQLGNSIGVLVVSLLLGQQHFAINTDALNLGFMLFIFCVGVEAGPNFFSIFFRDGKNYLMLALVMVGSAMLIAMVLGKVFGWDIGLTAGMLAGAMTSTPVLVGAGDTLRHFGLPSDQLAQSLDHLSLGYALTYLVGLVSLIVGARYMPKLQHQDLQTSAQQIARERGLDTDSKRKVYLPVIRAYRVGPELVAWADGKNLRELGIYRQTGCYIERIRRNGILANPDGDAVLQMGDDIALVGYPDAHARLDPSFRNGKEVFDRDLLDMRIVTEEIVVKNHNAVGRRLAQLKLTDHGCFLNRVIRSQIEMPIDDNVVLNKGDVLQVSGDARRVKTVADRIGFISIHSRDRPAGLLRLLYRRPDDRHDHLPVQLLQLRHRQRRRPAVRRHHAWLPARQPPNLRLYPAGGAEHGERVWPDGVYGRGRAQRRGRINNGLGAVGGQMLAAGLIVSPVPVVICFLFGAYVLRMNRAMLFGAMMGRAPAPRRWRSLAIPRAATFRRSAMRAPTPSPTCCSPSPGRSS